MIPEDFIDFLYWLKQRTEDYWANLVVLGEDPFNEFWAKDAKWIGMTEREIDFAESKYDIKFTKEHKQFLRILHTTDKKIPISTTWEEDSPIEFHSFFINWNEDENIKDKMNWPKSDLMDIIKKHPNWIESWGLNSKLPEENMRQFEKLYQKVPSLIPISSIRYTVDVGQKFSSPVLSIHQGDDAILYGGTMKAYLLNELNQEINLFVKKCDEEGDYYNSPIDEILKIKKAAKSNFMQVDLPIWKDVLLKNGLVNDDL